jgi:uroporphyrinogen decarboxylase
VFISDIVVPIKLAGIDVQIVPGKGPVLAEPIRSAAQIAALPPLDPDSLGPISRAVADTVAALGPVPLLGFAGAPFTLASYLVEGGPSRDHLRTKALMHGDPASWSALMSWVADVTGRFLREQVLAGASAVQLFDSWAGNLSPAQYAAGAAPFSARVFSSLDDLPVPRVHFGVGTGELLPAMHAAGADVIGVDHRISLEVASARLGGTVPLQGNIDPALLFAGTQVLHEHARQVLAAGQHAPGHVVNLGHGVPPDTDPGVLTELVDFIHQQPDPLQ